MSKKKNIVRPIGIDLFAGAGGLSLGFESAGFDIAAAVEIDPIHAATHEFNFTYCSPICCSVLDICGADIRRIADIGGTDIAVVFGGAPWFSSENVPDRVVPPLLSVLPGVRRDCALMAHSVYFTPCWVHHRWEKSANSGHRPDRCKISFKLLDQRTWTRSNRCLSVQDDVVPLNGAHRVEQRDVDCAVLRLAPSHYP